MGWGGRAVMAVGLLLLVAAAATGWRTYRFVATGRHVVGSVVRSAPDEPGDRSAGHPIVEFTTPDGHAVRAFQHSGAGVRYGTRMAVVYSPDDPESAVMDDFWSLWVAPLVLAWLGAFLFGGPLIGLLWKP